MSMRLSTRYTVVPLEAASLSMGVSACTKCDTSAMSGEYAIRAASKKGRGQSGHLRTPASMFPFGSCRACRASSISWQPKKIIKEVKKVGQDRFHEHTRRIDAADEHISQIFSILPFRAQLALRRNDPLFSLFRQAIQNSLSKRPIRDFKLQQQTLLLSFFALHLSQGTDKVPFGVS